MDTVKPSLTWLAPAIIVTLLKLIILFKPQ